MKRQIQFGRRALLAVAAVALMVVLAVAPPVAAQSCSMCYSSAQQQSPQQARALNIGILVLLVPSLLMFAGVMITAARRREEAHDWEAELTLDKDRE